MTRSIRELTFRRTVCDGIIRELMKMDDPRAPDAIEHYKKQLETLDAELTQAQRDWRAAHNIPEPEPVVVQMKTVQIFGESRK